MAPPLCQRCQSRMEPGFILDEGYGTRKPAAWVEGQPQRSIWTGLKLNARRRLPVQAWRCTRCGLLESYAPASNG